MVGETLEGLVFALSWNMSTRLKIGTPKKKKLLEESSIVYPIYWEKGGPKGDLAGNKLYLKEEIERNLDDFWIKI